MPREGTETLKAVNFYHITFSRFGNKMPREGTETLSQLQCNLFFRYHLEIRCPERGRKLFWHSIQFFLHHLEIRCPERGRKLNILIDITFSAVEFGNKMPREGTET